MRFPVRHLVSVASVTVLVLGCGKPQEKSEPAGTADTLKKAADQMQAAGKQMDEAAKQGGKGMEDAMKAMGQAMGTATGGDKVEPVDFRELKALLPESLPSMAGKGAIGEKTAAMGIAVSNAKQHYESADGNANADVEITDLGSMSGFGAMAAMAWAMVDIDKETEHGYEKTTTYQGFKAHEQYDRQDKSGSIEVIVASRFMVKVAGWGVDMEAIKAGLAKVDCAKLAAMKPQGVTK